MRSLVIGHGLDDPDLGPLVSDAQRGKVETHVARALADGAWIHDGLIGRAPSWERGHFMYPVLLNGVSNDMAVAREEVFGPVQCAIAFDDVDEAVELANDSEFGLAAGVFTNDLSTAHILAARLEVGQVHVNGYPLGGVDTPFGGYKASGIGREKGFEALEHYTQLKTVIVKLADPER
jgi:aldehyde dehydrogenase (NAD+)